jgi:hypothetical protein
MVGVTSTQTVHPKLKKKITFSVFVRTKIQPNRVVARRFFFLTGRLTGRCDVISAIAIGRPENKAAGQLEKGLWLAALCSSWKMKRPASTFTFYEGYGTIAS